MVSAAGNLSPFARSALSGASRASSQRQLGPVDPIEASKDPGSQEYRQLQELKTRDREVRQHEQAHAAAGGPHVQGGPSYQYERGPDGRLYATGGEVQIDTSPVNGDPEATIRKMQAVQRAALAPGEPSAQDRSVAASAAASEAQARTELGSDRGEGQSSASSEVESGPYARGALAAYRATANAPQDASIELIA